MTKQEENPKKNLNDKEENAAVSNDFTEDDIENDMVMGRRLEDEFDQEDLILKSREQIEAMEEQPIYMDKEEAKKYADFEEDPNFAIREEEDDDSDSDECLSANDADDKGADDQLSGNDIRKY